MLQYSHSNPLENKTIIIDRTWRRRSRKNTKGLPESKIVLDTSLRLQQLLEKHTPFTVLLTRESDTRHGHDQKALYRNVLSLLSKIRVISL